MSFREKFPVLAYYLGKKRQILRTLFYRKNPLKWTIKTYKKRFGITLNLDEPKLFYEKMNYWKHFKYNPDQDNLTDKVDVKRYLKELGYEKYCAKNYIVADNVKDIKKWFYKNKDKYNAFVFKTSHSCGDVFIYNNGKILKKNGRKIRNVKQVFKMLKMGLKFNHYYSCFEPNYKNLKPRIFVEEYIEDTDTIEYEIMCNYGEIKFLNIVLRRQSNKPSGMLFDSNFQFIDMSFGEYNHEIVSKISKPIEFLLIKDLIKKVCGLFPFCRVDFIQSSGRTHFCEFTFVKSGGMDIYKSANLNEKLGNLFKL